MSKRYTFLKHVATVLSALVAFISGVMVAAASTPLGTAILTQPVHVHATDNNAQKVAVGILLLELLVRGVNVKVESKWQNGKRIIDADASWNPDRLKPPGNS